MQHRGHADLARVAKIYDAEAPAQPISKDERLRRWINLLEENPGRKLQTLYETEFQPPIVRDAMRADNSAISVAFEDPILRREGLRGDTYGDAKKFFGLSDREIHFTLCFCLGGSAMSAGTAARRLEAFLPRLRRPGLFSRIAHVLRL